MELFWEVIVNTPIVFKLIFGGAFLYLVGCIIYAFTPDKKTAEGEFKKIWIKRIDDSICSVTYRSKVERHDNYLKVFLKLHTEIREVYGQGMMKLEKLTPERRDIIVHLLKRQNQIMGA